MSTAPSTAPSTTAASHRTASPQPGPSRLSRPPAPSVGGSADDVVVNPAPSSVPRGSILGNPVSAEVCTEISCYLTNNENHLFYIAAGVEPEEMYPANLSYMKIYVVFNVKMHEM